MEYKKITKDGYNFHFIKTSKFKTISIRINFKSEFKKEKITSYELLSGVLSSSTKNYPTLKDLTMKKEDLYQLGYGCSSMVSGKYMIFCAASKFIHEKYTEEGMNLKSIRFLLDSIFNPNLDNDSFKDDIFNLEKSDYMEYLEGKNDNPSKYASSRFNSIFGRNTTLEYDRSGEIDDLKVITSKSLYDTYLDMINSSLVDIFFIGDMDIDSLETIFDEYFGFKKSTSYSFRHEDNIMKKEVEEVKESSNFKQSKLRMGFVIDSMNLFEKLYVLPVYNFIFGGDSDSLLFKNVREKNSLCYDIHSNFSSMYSMIRVYSGIEKKDYDKCVSLIKEQHQNMILGNFSEEDILKVKLNYKASYLETMDSQNSILNTYEAHEYLGFDFIEDRASNIDKVTKEMVMEFAKKVHYQTTYFLEGNDEKGN